jgi:fatty-acyl-CoA synthase
MTATPTSSNLALTHWPQYLQRSLVKPQTTLYDNLAISTRRFGRQTAIGFFGRDVSYDELSDVAERFAGWLQNDVGLAAGDRVMLYMQNCPQWIMAYYGTQRADGVCVPANPMCKAQELKYLLQDSGAKVVVCSQELLPQVMEAMEGTQVKRVVQTCYADYLTPNNNFSLPGWLTAPAEPPPGPSFIRWMDVLATAHSPTPSQAKPGDLAVINYTSGSTGNPKGCMHSHQTYMHTMVGLTTWHGHPPGTVFLGVSPMYQVAGITVGVHGFVYVGGTIVPMPRWDRKLAAQLISHYQVHFAGIAPAAIIDMLADQEIDSEQLSSLRRVSFGGATMPDAVWQELNERLGLQFIEAYGMTETAATTHINPIHRPKRQCAGLPFFDTDCRLIDPDSLEEAPPGREGEIVISGPQLFMGYWGRPDETEESFVWIDGKKFFRSGDVGRLDDEGYLHITDRIKRMINASGFKVWPAEVENKLHDHPAIKEVCVIGANDPYRGETVKAVVVLHERYVGSVRAEDIIDWARNCMAAYKYPREVEFVQSLPRSPVGKVMWREMQEEENKRRTGATAN